MKIGLVCPYDISLPGGVQQLIVELADVLRTGGDDVKVVSAGRTTYEGGPGSDGSTVPVGRPVMLRGNDSAVPLSLSPLVFRRVKAALSSVDVVHVHEPLQPLVGWAGLSTGKPTVATFHADAPGWVERGYTFAPVTKLMGRTIITAVSPTARRAIPEAWGDVEIVPNALHVSSYASDGGRIRRRVSFLGRDDPRKGLDVLLEAWTEVRSAHPDAELVVMGANREVSPEGVEFKGRVTDGEKRRLLASSLIYVAPNLGGESFGIVVAEGMAAGCAVVASDLPAFSDVLGDTGVKFPVGDSKALASALIDLLSDPDRAVEIGDEARESVQRFDWDVVAGQYRALYERALS